MSKVTTKRETAILKSEMLILNHEFSKIAALATIAYQIVNIEHEENLYYLLGAIVDASSNAKSHMINRMNKLVEQEKQEDE